VPVDTLGGHHDDPASLDGRLVEATSGGQVSATNLMLEDATGTGQRPDIGHSLEV
jgi:hypothetical protein